MKKIYKNENLKKKIEETVNTLTVRDIYKPYIVDILLRRAFQYELSEEQIQVDLDTLKYSLKDIKMQRDDRTAAGLYFPESKNITLTTESFLITSNKENFETLTHEIYHALTHNEDLSDRLGGINKYTDQENIALLEVFVDKAANKTVYDCEQINDYWNTNAIAYGKTAFMIGLLEATYGVTEQELLSNGIQSRERLAEFLAEKSKTTTDEELLYLDRIEANLALIHNIEYKEEKYKFLDKGKILGSSIDSIENLCAKKMAERLKNEINDIGFNNLTEDKMEDYMYCYNKLVYILNESKKSFGLKYKLAGNIKNSINDKTKTLKNIITHTTDLVKNKFKVKDEETKTIVDMSIIGKIENYNEDIKIVESVLGISGSKTLEEHGIYLNELPRKNFKISKDVINRNKEDQRYSLEWDNQSIYKGLKRKIVIDTIKRNVKGLYSKNTKLLSDGKEQENGEEIINEENNLTAEERKKTKSWDLYKVDVNNKFVLVKRNYTQEYNNQKNKNKDENDSR